MRLTTYPTGGPWSKEVVLRVIGTSIWISFHRHDVELVKALMPDMKFDPFETQQTVSVTTLEEGLRLLERIVLVTLFTPYIDLYGKDHEPLYLFGDSE